MKNKLGYITSASYGKVRHLPKDYFDSYVSSTESKYITFRSTFQFSNYFEMHGDLPELMIENEVQPVSKEDLYKLTSVNIFDRKKLESNIDWRKE